MVFYQLIVVNGFTAIFTKTKEYETWHISLVFYYFYKIQKRYS